MIESRPKQQLRNKHLLSKEIISGSVDRVNT